MNGVIYEAEVDSLTKRLDIIDRTLAWLDAKGCRFTRSARELASEKAETIRRLLQIEDLTAYDDVD